MNQPRVRIAPSPTGDLHVGTARTALFNYLFAKKYNGKFILRIEDTDLERSKEKYIQNIYDSLKALGLYWDEGPDIGGSYGPYIQSDRLEIYKNKALELLHKDMAYYCYCTQEELEHEKQQAKLQKKDYIYNRRCLNLSEKQKEQFIQEGRKPTLRFKMPHRELTWKDIVRGEVTFDTSLIGDFVIMKSNNTPTYNFAVVIDDLAMEITHVIRGEDHISNTPKQIMIYEAFKAQIPEFAHVGMILAEDKSKLSKRHGATAVSEFIDQGYLPEAFVNFLALLGWSPPDEEEVKFIEQIIEVFELERVSHSPAVFNKEKLNWLNGVYIRKLPLEDITQRSKRFLHNYDLTNCSEDKLKAMINAVRDRLTLLSEVTESLNTFFVSDVEITPEVRDNALTGEHVRKVLEEFLQLTDKLNFEDLEVLNEQFKAFRKSLKPLKPKFIMMPIRATLTGQLHGADLNTCIQLLGKEEVKKRVNKVLSSI